MTTTTLEVQQATGELSPHWVNRAAFQLISALMVLNGVLPVGRRSRAALLARGATGAQP